MLSRGPHDPSICFLFFFFHFQATIGHCPCALAKRICFFLDFKSICFRRINLKSISFLFSIFRRLLASARAPAKRLSVAFCCFLWRHTSSSLQRVRLLLRGGIGLMLEIFRQQLFRQQLCPFSFFPF